MGLSKNKKLHSQNLKKKDKLKHKNANNSISSFNSSKKVYYSLEEEVESLENEDNEENKENEDIACNNNKIDKNNNKEINLNGKIKDIKENSSNNNINIKVKRRTRNITLKRKLIEKIQHNNITKGNKKNKNKIININKNIINKNFLNDIINDKIIFIDEPIDDNNHNKNDVNTSESNTSISKKRSKSIGNVNGFLSFNKNQSHRRSNNMKYIIKSPKTKHIEIRKEVQDILNSNLFNNSNNDIERIPTEKDENKFKRRLKRDMMEDLGMNKKKFEKIKKERRKSIIDFLNDMNNEEENNEENKEDKNLEDLDREEKERIIEQRLKIFFEKIQKLKNIKVKNYEEELKKFIDEEIDKIEDFEAKDKENRINTFYRDFELNRKKLFFLKKFLKRDLVFASPLRFCSTSSDFKKIKK